MSNTTTTAAAAADDPRARAIAQAEAGDYAGAAKLLEATLQASLIVQAIPDRKHREILFHAVKEHTDAMALLLPTLLRIKSNLRGLGCSMARGGHDPLKLDAAGAPTHEAQALRRLCDAEIELDNLIRAAGGEP